MTGAAESSTEQQLAGATKVCPLCEGDYAVCVCQDVQPGPGRAYFFGNDVRMKIPLHGHGYVWYLPAGCRSHVSRWKTCEEAGCQGWVANAHGWPEAAVAAGAKVFRSWWNNVKQTWWADVRFIEIGESSVMEADTRQEAEYAALCRAVESAGGTLLVV